MGVYLSVSVSCSTCRGHGGDDFNSSTVLFLPLVEPCCVINSLSLLVLSFLTFYLSLFLFFPPSVLSVPDYPC